ncbi:zinc finger protein 436-like [Suncus etruscus]|uniref:zinc finger protein 436-like n=1 Tax=Suncus etruscus TaxID=109475 RepID=UPI00210FA900|nr:zinc finger protein 436-like [Suncus etruscus]
MKANVHTFNDFKKKASKQMNKTECNNDGPENQEGGLGAPSSEDGKNSPVNKQRKNLTKRKKSSCQEKTRVKLTDHSQNSETSIEENEENGKGLSSASPSHDHASTNTPECQDCGPESKCSAHVGDSSTTSSSKNPDEGENVSTEASHQSKPMKKRSKNKVCLCDRCGKCFRRALELKIHYRSHMSEKPYNCKECGKGFVRSSHLTEHMYIHSGERPHMCDICGKGFSCASNLKRHLKTHNGQRPYECHICEKTFIQAINLDYHIKSHTGKKAHQCQQCGECFRLPAQLRYHQQKHSGKRPNEKQLDRERPHKCTECGKSFIQSCNLISHMKIHPEIEIPNFALVN